MALRSLASWRMFRLINPGHHELFVLFNGRQSSFHDDNIGPWIHDDNAGKFELPCIFFDFELMSTIAEICDAEETAMEACPQDISSSFR